MKKIVTVIVLAALMLSLAACGALAGKEVAVLWADAGKTVSPNSLHNAMDRALYIEKITYTYYGAEGNAQTQITQAEAAVKAGCSALMVQAVDAESAAACVELAKANKIPVVFFGCTVDAAVVAGYDKCVAVCTDAATLNTGYFDMVSAYVLGNTEVKKAADDDMDLDDDGKISYVTVGEIGLTETKAIEKDKNGEPKLEKDGSYTKAVELVKLDAAFETLALVEETEEGGFMSGPTTYRHLQTADGKAVEMILVADDQQAMDILLALQAMNMNAAELGTAFVPVFTVGTKADYKALVLKDAPTGEEARKAHFEANKYLCDLTVVEEEVLDEMIFTTVNVVDAGRISGTVMEDYDAVAEAAAAATAALLTGKTAEQTQLIPYTTYGG